MRVKRRSWLQADHRRVADPGRAVVVSAVGKKGRKLGLPDAATGGKPAARDGPQIDGPEVIVGLHDAEAPGGLQRAP